MNVTSSLIDPEKKAEPERMDTADGRNLAFEFEKLYTKDTSIESTPSGKCIENSSILCSSNDKNSSSSKENEAANAISPTCVIEESKQTKRNLDIDHRNLNSCNTEGHMDWTSFNFHPELKRDLTQSQLDRISIYSVIYDINKEAAGMSVHDISVSESTSISSEMQSAAIIDEEKWLLGVIASRPQDEMRYRPCPPTFAESIGEEERALAADVSREEFPNGTTPNPLSLLSVSRTQLWKPSRSWWEARSGRNPWIDPKSHNKRWRYLWPLIHYHKFIARCIKKLKRNGVDVKRSFSPLSVFLRDEVCSVSDHLGSVSEFSAEEWLKVLSHFDGWTNNDPKKEENLRMLVSQLKLKGLSEHNDVQSPLLRDQIDEQFLRAMQHARSQTNGDYKNSKEKTKMNDQTLTSLSKISNQGNVYSCFNLMEGQETKTQKPSNDNRRHGSKIRNKTSTEHNYNTDSTAPLSNYAPVGHEPYFHGPYHPPTNMPPAQYMPHYYPPPDQQNMYYIPGAGLPYTVPPMQYQQQNQEFHQNDNPSYYYGSPSFSRNYHHNFPETDDYSVTSTCTGATGCSVPSPHWSHLDPLAMTGIASPQGEHFEKKHMKQRYKKGSSRNKGGVSCAKPLLIHPHPPPLYNQRQHGGGYVPPSPASQFYNTLSPYHCAFDPRASHQQTYQSEAFFQPPGIVGNDSEVQTPLRNNKVSLSSFENHTNESEEMGKNL